MFCVIVYCRVAVPVALVMVWYVLGSPCIVKCMGFPWRGLLLCPGAVSVNVAVMVTVSFQYPVAGFMVIFVGVLFTVSVVVLVVPV